MLKGSPYSWRVFIGTAVRNEAQGRASAMPKHCPIQCQWGNPFARWISIRIFCGRCHYESFFR
eukprot:7486591-Pyramimonas_sp.AAC.1